MKQRIKSLSVGLHPWQIVLLSIMGAVVITDLITGIISLWVWHEIQPALIILGTINAVFVPLIILPVILRSLRKIVKLEEENQTNNAKISQLEKQKDIDASIKRRADEMSLLYQLGISLASGKDLYETLLTLQREIIKLIQADVFFVAIYDESTDLITYPIFFEEGDPRKQPSRHLSEYPGLAGPIVYNKQTLYLRDFRSSEALNKYTPVDDDNLSLHTFLGIPLMVNDKAIGVLSVQSKRIDAYSTEQIQLMENIAVQAALAIEKARLLDQMQQELDERRKVDASLLERESILEAVTFAAERLLKTADWRSNINPILERLGKTINASHAYIFEQHTDSHGQSVYSMRFEWTNSGFISDLENPNFQNTASFEEDFEHYYTTLKNGEPFIGSTSLFIPVEKDHFFSLGIKAILEVPLVVNGQWWGTIGFDDMVRERAWSSSEVDALKIAGGILSAAIQRQKADAAVQESERIYRQAIEAADAIPYYQDYESDTYLFMGAGIRELTGYGPEEINSQIWSNIIEETVMVDEAEGLSTEEASRLVRTGALKTWKCDRKFRTRDGQIRWLTDRSVEVFGEKDLSIGSIGILQDITRRKLIEEGLRKRESILEAITFSAEQFLKAADWREKINVVLERLGQEFNASHAYLFEKHLLNNDETVSSMTYEWTTPGLESDLGEPEFQNLPANSMGFERLYEILDNGEPLVGSATFFTETEKEYLNSINVKTLLEIRVVINGKDWGTLGVDDTTAEREWNTMEVDVIKVAAGLLGAAIKRQMDEEALKSELAERKRAEQALIFSEEKFSKAFHTTPVMMTIEDADNVFIDVNQAFMDNIGFDRDDIIGRRASELGILLVPDDTQKAQNILKDQDTFKDLELSFQRKSGKIFTVLMSTEEINVNNITYILTSALDITERKHAEAEREKLIVELEAKNEELERFTYTVSHDLKSPLVTINGFLGYLEQDAASGNMERLKKDTRRIQEAVNKMQRLLNELLELSRIGRMMNAPVTLSFKDLVDEALDIVHGQFEKLGITIQTQPDLPAVFGDKPRLIEVLQNILDNAAKYMGDQISPHIEIGYAGDENDRSVFYVKDNGIGIEPEYHERVFGLFNKLDAKSEGTGVGLALVKRIIEVHSGRIWVESDAGKGSTFYFTLPKPTAIDLAGG